MELFNEIARELDRYVETLDAANRSALNKAFAMGWTTTIEFPMNPAPFNGPLRIRYWLASPDGKHRRMLAERIEDSTPAH